MQAILENLTREEFFNMQNSNNLGTYLQKNTGGISTTGKIVIAVVIAGILVYVFHDQIDDFIQRLSDYPNYE